ncbi:MAG: hypothetical protein ABIG71_04360 [Candidatus Uhrbacteria bacterium]
MQNTEVEQAKVRVKKLREQLRDEITGEVQQQQRRRLWRQSFVQCGGCCTVYLVILLAICACGTYLVARTGLVTIPVLSDSVQHQRTPLRVVTPVAMNIEQRVGGALAGLLRGDPSAPIAFSEAELTSLLRAILTDRETDVLTATSAQVVVTQDALELFAWVPGSGDGTTVRVRGVPQVTDDGKLDVVFDEVAIGNLGLPSVIATPILRSALSNVPFLNGTDTTVPFRLQRITLGDGRIVIDISKAQGP